MLKRLCPILFLILLVSSCTKDKFKATVPSYLKIESISLETESYEGSSSEKITEAWVSMDGNFLGAFELPCTVPILAEGEHEFVVYAGVKANGISATRIKYPFYENCDLYLKGSDGYVETASSKVELFKDSTVVVKGFTAYTDDTEFLFIEDFEDAGSILEASDLSDTTLIKTFEDSLVFEGYGSAAAFIDETNDMFEFISSEFRPISNIYNPTMLELNYRCDHSFKVGVAVKSGEDGVIDRYESLHISPSAEWNKIYVHMTNQINLGGSDDMYGIFIGINKSESSETASFYFDNIKWLHQQ